MNKRELAAPKNIQITNVKGDSMIFEAAQQKETICSINPSFLVNFSTAKLIQA